MRDRESDKEKRMKEIHEEGKAGFQPSMEFCLPLKTLLPKRAFFSYLLISCLFYFLSLLSFSHFLEYRILISQHSSWFVKHPFLFCPSEFSIFISQARQYKLISYLHCPYLDTACFHTASSVGTPRGKLAS